MTEAPSGTVLITGATGLVGTRLVQALSADGVPVRALSRDPHHASSRFAARNAKVTAFGWDGLRPPREAIDGAQAVVHLAGEPVFGGILTRARRARIRNSRVRSTEEIVAAIERCDAAARPRVLVSASAVGWYGDRGDEPLREDAAPGEGFLAGVCVEWERAAQRAEALGLRVVRLRIGIVLAHEGGALPRMSIPVRLGLGGPLGSGRQFVPWIHADDLVGLARLAIDDARIRGPLNATAPEAARNRDLVSAIARRLRRPAFLPLPGFVLRLALGDLAIEMLGSRRCVPARALDAGFRFAHADLDEALSLELD